MNARGSERRPGVILGTPGAFLVAGVLCLAFAGLVTVAISYQPMMLCYYGGCSGGFLQYIAYPLLYIGWLLVIVGAAAFLYAFFVGRNRPSHGDLTYSEVGRQDLQRSYPGVEEPAVIPTR